VMQIFIKNHLINLRFGSELGRLKEYSLIFILN